MKLKNGQYKDFLHLAVAYKLKYGSNEVYSRIMSASVSADLCNVSAKTQRELMYNPDGLWLQVVDNV